MIVRLLPLLALGAAVPAQAAVLGSDAAACTAGEGPAILAEITGMKDASGEVRLELYPATEADFMADDHELLAQGKTFRRVRIPARAQPFALCIRVPHPGRYALVLTHNRAGKDKFNIWQDGAGFASNRRIGRSKPSLAIATVDAGPHITTLTIKVQYLRGLGGFAPLDR